MSGKTVLQWQLSMSVVALCACSESLMLDDGDKGSEDAHVAGARGTVDGGGRSGSEEETEDAQQIPITHWTGNPESCPSTAPEDRSQCDVDREGLVCGYFFDTPENSGQSSYRECGCRSFCGTVGAPEWNCYRNMEAPRMACPEVQPEHGASCYGLRGYRCFYPPLVTCSCPSESEANWECAHEGRYVPGPPADVDAGKRVSELSSDERVAWCHWFTKPEPGFPERLELKPDADGYYPDTGCYTTTDLDCDVLMPSALSAGACTANLELSSCEAPVSELNDCVRTIMSTVPQPRGCARYLEAPGCSGTIVIGRDARAPGDSTNERCRVRVR